VQDISSNLASIISTVAGFKSLTEMMEFLQPARDKDFHEASQLTDEERSQDMDGSYSGNGEQATTAMLSYLTSLSLSTHLVTSTS
jgi:hypothetical protein